VDFFPGPVPKIEFAEECVLAKPDSKPWCERVFRQSRLEPSSLRSFSILQPDDGAEEGEETWDETLEEPLELLWLPERRGPDDQLPLDQLEGDTRPCI
jgi:hypothetical protein